MTRKCAWCGKFLEEVCPECGRSATALARAKGWRARIAHWLLRFPSNVFFCSNFGKCSTVIFTACGVGPLTHGICPGCRKKEAERERRVFESSAAKSTVQ